MLNFQIVENDNYNKCEWYVDLFTHIYKLIKLNYIPLWGLTFPKIMFRYSPSTSQKTQCHAFMKDQPINSLKNYHCLLPIRQKGIPLHFMLLVILQCHQWPDYTASDNVFKMNWRDWKIWLHSSILLEGTSKIMKYLSQDSWCSSRSSNWATMKYKSKALPLHQPIWFF
jgi:hypothetical protein